MVSAEATQFCRCSIKTTINSQWTNGCGLAPIEHYLQKQIVIFIWPVGHSLLTPLLLPFFPHHLLCVVPFHCHPCHLVVTRWLPRLSVAQPHMVETKAGAKEARKTTFSSQEVQQTSCYKSFAKAGAERTGFTGLACLQHESSFGLSTLLSNEFKDLWSRRKKVVVSEAIVFP